MNVTTTYQLSTYYLGPDENSLIFNYSNKNPWKSWDLINNNYENKGHEEQSKVCKCVNGMYIDIIEKNDNFYHQIKKIRSNDNYLQNYIV